MLSIKISLTVYKYLPMKRRCFVRID
jgi:hypothetical protein